MTVITDNTQIKRIGSMFKRAPPPTQRTGLMLEWWFYQTTLVQSDLNILNRAFFSKDRFIDEQDQF